MYGIYERTKREKTADGTEGDDGRSEPDREKVCGEGRSRIGAAPPRGKTGSGTAGCEAGGPGSLVRACGRSLSAAEAVAVAVPAEAEQDDDPENIASATAAAVSYVRDAVPVAAAAQQQDQKDNIAAAVSSIASATTVCCRQITHFCSSRYSVYTPSYVSLLATVSRILGNTKNILKRTKNRFHFEKNML